MNERIDKVVSDYRSAALALRNLMVDVVTANYYVTQETQDYLAKIILEAQLDGARAERKLLSARALTVQKERALAN